MSDTVTALQAFALRRYAGKPLAECDRLYRLESSEGREPGAAVSFERIGAPVDYAALEARERAAGLPWPPASSE